MRRFLESFLMLVAVAIVGCTTGPEQVRKALMEDPTIVYDAMAKDPLKFTMMLQKVTMEARRVAQEEAEKADQARVDEQIKTPLEPKIADDRAYLGNKKSPYKVVVYSDFQCPYCAKGYQVVEELKAKYKDKLYFVFKQFPLDMHPLAMPAAKRFEAIAMQSFDKAYKFHDEIFKNQKGLNAGGEKFLDATAKKLGVNVAQMKKDMESDKVKARIAEDLKEGQSFGVEGTPGFVVSGVLLKGAYPAEMFDMIFEKRQVASDAEAAKAAPKN